MCVFVGTGLIYKEIDKKTLYTVLSRPLARWQFIVGKYLGMGATLVVAFALMGGVFCCYYAILGGSLHWLTLGAVFLLLTGLMLLNAIAIFFSTMASPTVSAICTVAVFIVGRGTHELKFLAQTYCSGISRDLIMGVYYLLPNFSNSSISS